MFPQYNPKSSPETRLPQSPVEVAAVYNRAALVPEAVRLVAQSLRMPAELPPQAEVQAESPPPVELSQDSNPNVPSMPLPNDSARAEQARRQIEWLNEAA